MLGHLGKLALAMHPDKPGGSKVAFQASIYLERSCLWRFRSCRTPMRRS